ncbi:DUF4333 domain-containing protein [Actinomycetospora sp. NBRC 106378]|uniref:DUF4333 domain-containing protein n=1 Tax=Actinomycetospora sp. NBRC 106378 TaxID=3032208 RepID=UPI002552F809|nr:DUF4333 domain-containing protein [Actinomycetospora sp. NBRC 106378]
MTNTAGESSAPVPEDAPEATEVTGATGDAGEAPSGEALSRTTGVRWGDAPPSAGRDEDATPPSGFTAPAPGEAVPVRATGAAPDPTPGAAWPPAFAPGPWQQTAPGWAPPAAPPPDPARRRRVRRIVLGVVLGVVVVALVVVALLAFVVGPRFARYDVLDRAAVERGVTDVVTRDWKRQVTGVSCPDDERVRPGTTFFCSGTVDGRPARIPVDVVDESGTYEVGQPR